jgi:FMN phosphatase YigB (HAD superfamily)
MKENPEKTLFVDDHMPHIERALNKNINGILFKDLNDFKKRIKEYFDNPEF